MVFSKVSIITISITITLNILKYIRKTLNIKTLICLYQKLLDCLNIIYTIALITSSDFKNLKFLITQKINDINNIEKTIIFVKENKALEIY